MEPKEITDILAAWFEIPAPTVCIDNRRVNGVYWPLRKVIQVSRKAWRGVENSVIHEFAHHLQRMRHGIRSADGVRVRPHGPEFLQALQDVVVAWFGDSEKYAWGTEYASVRAWHGKRQGKKIPAISFEKSVEMALTYIDHLEKVAQSKKVLHTPSTRESGK